MRRPKTWSRLRKNGTCVAAADVFALGVLDGLDFDRAGRGGPSPVIGGFDWMREAQLTIDKRRLNAPVGGHFLEGGTGLGAVIVVSGGGGCQPELGSAAVALRA